MANGVRMKVEKQIVGNHDPRILLGSNPQGGFAWGGGEEIFVTPELAANYERSGIAVRIQEKREAAALVPQQAATIPPPSKRGGVVPFAKPSKVAPVGEGEQAES